MKYFLKNLIATINKILLRLSYKNMSLTGSTLFLVKTSLEKNNKLKMIKTKLEKVRFSISGEHNEVNTNNAVISNSSINIKGNNNTLFLYNNVKLRGATVNIRGNGCSITIGENSSFGGVRMINVGENNPINIGKDCLFSDHIEIWASDTHSILNANNEMINPEKPINIKDRVWVGSHVTILKGVTIGSDSIIGMGTIVTQKVQPKSISVGVPNRTIRENVTWKLDY